MATDVTRASKGRSPATHSPEVDFALVLSRVIDSAKENPAELRHAIYEIARIKLRQEVWNTTPPVDDSEMERLAVALETAIERVEAISLMQEKRRPLQWFDGLIQNLSQGASVHPPPEPVLVINNDKTTKGNFLVPKVPSHLWSVPALSQFWKRPASTPLLRAASVVLVSVAILYGVFANQFGVHVPQPASSAATVRPDTAAETPVIALPPNPLTTGRDFPLPSAYGIYAITSSELFELDTLPGRAPDPRIFMSALINKPSRTILPNGRVSFLAFRRDFATSAPERVSVRVIASVMRAMAFDARGNASVTKVEGEWAIRNVIYNFRVAPLTEQPEMLIINPDAPNFVLPAGRYGMVLKDVVYDFSVAGSIADKAQCLERTGASNGTFYSECRDP